VIGDMLARMSKAPASSITYIGRTNHRNSDLLFGIRQADRRMHMLAIGKTGTGKSHLLRLMFEQDVRAHRGCALFDPHGDLARALRDTIATDRRADLVFIDPLDPSSPWRFNPFAGVAESNRSLAAAGIVDVFKKLWIDDWGPRLEHLLRNVAFALLEVEGTSFGDVPRLLTDRDYRLDLVAAVTNDTVRAFWTQEYAAYTAAFRATVIAPLQNKIGALLTDPVLRRFFTSEGTRLDPRQLIDQGKIVVVNLDKGQLGEASTSVLGSLLVSHLALAGLSRSDQPEADRRDCAIYLDEFQSFTTEALANMLSELRKYRLSMVLGTQYLSAIEPAVLDAVLGNVGTIVCFRVGADDAVRLARELGDPVTSSDLTGLPRHNVLVRLLIEGQPSRAFSAEIPESIAGGNANDGSA
jgi:type IV secretory pathway TraG/TraD family ATPase VirD4